jgi:hypothetical protein
MEPATDNAEKSLDKSEPVTDTSTTATNTTNEKPRVFATEIEDDDVLSSLLSNISVLSEPEPQAKSKKPQTEIAAEKRLQVDATPLSLSRSSGSSSRRKKNSLISHQQSILKRDSSVHSLCDSARSAASSIQTSTRPAPIKRVNSNVSFNSVNIREYDRTIGDNPSCSLGIPISLDWSHSGEVTHNLNDYEKFKHLKKNRFVTRIPAKRRESLVKMNLGYSDEEIKLHLKDTKKVQRSRSLTDLVSPYWRLHDICQSASRKIKRKIKINKKKNTDMTPHEMAVEDAISRSSSNLSYDLNLSKECSVSLNGRPRTSAQTKLISTAAKLDRSSGSTSSTGEMEETLEF